MRVFNVTLLFMCFWRAFKKHTNLYHTLWATSHTHTIGEMMKRTRVVVVVIVLFVDVSCKHTHVFARARVLSYIETVSSHLYHFLPGHTNM